MGKFCQSVAVDCVGAFAGNIRADVCVARSADPSEHRSHDEGYDHLTGLHVSL